VLSIPGKGNEIIYRATPHQRPASTGYRRNRSISNPKRASLMSNNNTRSQADATITPSTQKLLVDGTTLPLPSLPDPLPKRKKKPNKRQKTGERTYLFSIISQTLLSIISGTFSRLSCSNKCRCFNKHLIAIASNASTPSLAVECNEGGTLMGLCSISWSCDDSGVEFLVTMVSDQERPEVGEWLSERLRRMGGIVCIGFNVQSRVKGP
jgi:hypothetical protein